MNERLRQLFDELVTLLERHGEPSVAQAASVSAAEGRLDEFLRSNELWGGPGSIADQAGVSAERSADRKAIEGALIALGEEQIRQGIVNPRTAMWVGAFVAWKQSGI